jgi:hypothetical protein
MKTKRQVQDGSKEARTYNISEMVFSDRLWDPMSLTTLYLSISRARIEQSNLCLPTLFHIQVYSCKNISIKCCIEE